MSVIDYRYKSDLHAEISYELLFARRGYQLQPAVWLPMRSYSRRPHLCGICPGEVALGHPQWHINKMTIYRNSALEELADLRDAQRERRSQYDLARYGSHGHLFLPRLR